MARPTLLLTYYAVFACFSGVALASASLVNRRILEGEHGWTDVIRHLADYEIHDFAKHAPTRRALSAAGEKTVSYELNVLGRRMMLELERNDALFAEGYEHVYKDGDRVVEREGAPNCIYKGHVVGDEESVALLALCDDMVQATVRHKDAEKDFTIQPLDLKSRSSMHVAYHHRNLADSERFCGVGRHYNEKTTTLESTEENGESIINTRLRRLREKHNHAVVGVETVLSKARQLGTTKFIGVSVVNDLDRFNQKGKQVHAHSAQLFSTVAALYDKIGVTGPASNFKFTIQLVSMYTFVKANPWTFGSPPSQDVTLDSNGEISAEDMLTVFDTWRGTSNGVKPTGLGGHDLAHLLTGKTFTGGTIGLAWLDGICSSQRMGETQATALTDAHIASTITHEIGHNLGSRHIQDTPPSGPVCTNDAPGELIMSASSGKAFTNWDKCSMAWFNKFFTSSDYTARLCAEVTSSVLWGTGPVCGDGIVQGTEQCDCINGVCNVAGADSCCDGATCQFISGAQCSALDLCCDLPGCTITSDVNRVCRAAVGECDIAEKCLNNDGKCPFDKFKDTGIACTVPSINQPGTCISKKCVSADAECKARGIQLGAPHDWDRSCNNKDGIDILALGECDVTCSKGIPSQSTCESFATPQNYEDGVQCQNGKGCYKGNCINFAQIPVNNNEKCDNGVVDQEETDVDCGGPNCFECVVDQLCKTTDDCVPPGACSFNVTVDANGYTGLGRCTETAAPVDKCDNGVVDQNETDVDCGGPNCSGCDANQLCRGDQDCLPSGVCNTLVTVDANGYVGLGRCTNTAAPIDKCDNGMVDQNETDVDCGGPNCSGCDANQLCRGDQDCFPPGACNMLLTVDANGYVGLGHCTNTAAPIDKCDNGMVDQNETDVDCGGPNCSGCVANQLCRGDHDCSSRGGCNLTVTLNANGYEGLGVCTDVEAAGQLESALEWFQQNAVIWAPILGAIVLLCFLGCYCWTRRSRSPVANKGVLKVQHGPVQ